MADVKIRPENPYSNIIGSDPNNTTGMANGLNYLYAGQTSGFTVDSSVLASQTPHRKQSIMIFLVRTPRLFEESQFKDELNAGLKVMLETGWSSISGFNSTRQLALNETPIGYAGQNLYTPQDSRLSPLSITWNGVELENRVYGGLTNYIIDNFYMHYNSSTPALLHMNNRNSIKSLLLDDYSFDILAVEPNSTLTDVVRSYLCLNLLFSNAAEEEGSADISAGTATIDLSFTIQGYLQIGPGVDIFAKGILDVINSQGGDKVFNPLPYNQIDPDINKISAGLLHSAGIGNNSEDLTNGQSLVQAEGGVPLSIDVNVGNA